MMEANVFEMGKVKYSFKIQKSIAPESFSNLFHCNGISRSFDVLRSVHMDDMRHKYPALHKKHHICMSHTIEMNS